MISDMRRMAESYLEGLGNEHDAGLDPERTRLIVLCERHEVGTPVYVLHPGEGDSVRLVRREVRAGESWRAPFIKVAPNAAYLVPVFKVEGQRGGAESKRETTLLHFDRQSRDGPAAPYFWAVLRILRATRFVANESHPTSVKVRDAYGAAVKEIVSQSKAKGKASLLVVALDHRGDTWPGDDPQLVTWLLGSADRLSIYGKPVTVDHLGAACSLCGAAGPLFPNALPGAKLNFVNGDFRGSFPGGRPEEAWKRFAACATCADLLYIFKNHVSGAYTDRVAGGKVLIIPSTDALDPRTYERYLNGIREAVNAGHPGSREGRVLRKLADDASVATLSILWADFKDKIEGIRGFVTHVLPTRLAELDREVNGPYNRRRHPFYPRDLRSGVRREIDLNLMLADELLKRPGGDKVKTENRSPRRHSLLRQLAACVYHKLRMEPGPLWQEIDRTARAYWTDLLGQEDATILYALRYEAPKQLKEGKWCRLTLHGWARYLYFFLDYLSDDRVGVLPKETPVYEANHESLRPLLAEANGLDNDAKRFTFLLGILYGHLIFVQSRKAEVNVSANALSWMRGGRLRAAELHDLYGKVAYKLQEYDALEVGRYRKWKLIHELEAEISHLGTRVHIPVSPEDLPDEQVLYFLMLGIALSYDVTNPDKPKAEGDAR